MTNGLCNWICNTLSVRKIGKSVTSEISPTFKSKSFNNECDKINLDYKVGSQSSYKETLERKFKNI